MADAVAPASIPQLCALCPGKVMWLQLHRGLSSWRLEHLQGRSLVCGMVPQQVCGLLLFCLCHWVPRRNGGRYRADTGLKQSMLDFLHPQHGRVRKLMQIAMIAVNM